MNYYADQVCLDNVIISGPNGEGLETNVGGCIDSPAVWESTLPIYINNSVEVAGFQFSLEGGEILGADGGSLKVVGLSILKLSKDLSL